MDFVYILAQVFAIIACAFYTISVQCKKRKTILLLLFIIGDIIGAIGLLLLKAYVGALIQIVFGIETFINYILEIKKKKNTPMFVVIYIGLSVLVSAVAFKNIVDLIPLVCAVLHTVTIIQEKERKIRYTNLISLILWVPYYIAFLAWVNLASTLFIIVSNIISIFRYDFKK